MRKLLLATPGVVDTALAQVVIGWLCFAAVIVLSGASPAAATLMVIARVLP